MTAITLPTLPLIQEAKCRLLTFGVRLEPGTGGPVQRAQRMGSRFGAELQIAALGEKDAGQLLGVILEAANTGATVVTSWPQAAGQAHGTPLVNGGSQAGSTLAIDGLNSLIVKAGTFFSFSSGGRIYLHMVTRDVTPVAGAATLTIAPMLRVSPADNTPLSMATPQIEGFLSDACNSWTIDMLTARSFTLAIDENE